MGRMLRERRHQWGLQRERVSASSHCAINLVTSSCPLYPTYVSHKQPNQCSHGLNLCHIRFGCIWSGHCSDPYAYIFHFLFQKWFSRNLSKKTVFWYGHPLRKVFCSPLNHWIVATACCEPKPSSLFFWVSDIYRSGSCPQLGNTPASHCLSGFRCCQRELTI